MSTVGDILSYVRTRLEEDTPRKWSNAQLITYISESERWLAGWLSRLKKSRRFRVIHESITLPVNTATYDLTTLAKPFDWLISVSVVVANYEHLLIDFEEDDQPYLRNLGIAGGSPISRIDLQDDNLVVLPTFGEARTLYVAYGWIPLKKTSSVSTIETPPKYDGDLVERVTHFALADAGQRNTAFEDEYAGRLSEIADFERSRRGTSNEKVLQRSRFFAGLR